ncbi:adenylate kinase [Ancylostoma ceylanicum]|uniref:Adenylate kinase isoenzyme 1 n=1 Tax=Ancylostoma ceylanicum TaxID=53326 RepID=A0A0D6LZZ5_9BILA|nr:adenylate kinase [Ancylostoma ceylanicum]
MKFERIWAHADRGILLHQDPGAGTIWRKDMEVAKKGTTSNGGKKPSSKSPQAAVKKKPTGKSPKSPRAVEKRKSTTDTEEKKKSVDLTPLKNAHVPIFFIIGGPGSGKATLGKKLAEKYGLSHVSTGDILRAEMTSLSPLGIKISKVMEAGELVPVDVVLDLLKAALVKKVAKPPKAFLIDGYPCDVKQAEQFDTDVEGTKQVIYLEAPDDVLTERLLKRGKTSGRIDDNEGTIKKRLKAYNTEIPSVVKYYEKKNKLVKIDAKGTIEEVFAAAVKQLDDVMAKLPQPIERKTINMAPLRKTKLPIFFIVGGPGSGKGTQCERIVAKYGFSHLSSGDLLREEVKSGSPRGAQLAKIMEAGELVPLEIVLDLLKEAMVKEAIKGSKGFLIDGYPREVRQGQLFEKEIQPAKSVIFFDVSDDILVERLLNRAKTSGRADDNIETIKKRLQTFATATTPVVAHYEMKKKLARIPAHGTVDEIFAEVAQHIDTALKKKDRTTTIARALIDLAPLKKAGVPIFFIIGGPGSGKGTQCEKLAAKFGLSHLSSGDLLREEVKSRTPRGGVLSKIMEAGDLVPLEVVLDLIKEAIVKKVARGSKGFLIDGYPMDVEEGEKFEEEIQEAKFVIFLEASDEVLTERLLKRAKTSERADDNRETIGRRLKTFATVTAPVVDYYDKKKKLIRIKAEGTEDEIFEEIVKHLEGHVKTTASNQGGMDMTPLKKAAVPVFFILGGPGSGRGTQCQKMAAKYGLSHLSSGELLRNEEIVLDLLKEAMLKEIARCSKGFLIDGYPLEVRQGERFEEEVQEPRSVIFFDASDDTLLKRLLKRARTSGRDDDNLDTMRKLLQLSKTATAPLVEYYESKNKLVRIQAEGTVDEIFAEVVKHLDTQMGKKSDSLTVERKPIDLTPLKKAGVPIFFIVGGPGSGKGTQCEKIVAKYELSHLSSGDLLREEVGKLHVKSGSPRGAQLTKIMEAGELVPLEVVLDLIKEAMLKEVGKGSKGFLIDGYPREVKQGEEFEKEIQEAKSVIFFDAPDEILVERLMNRAKTSGRADDNMETIKKRLKTFTTATAPVVDYYEKKNKLVRIMAKGTVDEIFAMVVKHLDVMMATTPGQANKKGRRTDAKEEDAPNQPSAISPLKAAKVETG